MRRIYLARHGAIEKPGTGSYCLGRTDWPLSDEGRGQAALLRAWFEDMPGLSARTSPLARCRETARIALEKDAPAEPRLAELDMGEWDGLSFAEIRERWPEEYRLRGESLCAHVPPGAEAPEAALERALPLLDAPGATRAFFTHAGVLRLLRCRLEARPLDEMLSVPADYAGVSLLVEDASGWRAAGWNVRPAKTPSADESEALLAQLPEHIAAHCRAVQALALEMTDALAAGWSPPPRCCTIYAACSPATPKRARSGWRAWGTERWRMRFARITTGAEKRSTRRACCSWPINTYRMRST